MNTTGHALLAVAIMFLSVAGLFTGVWAFVWAIKCWVVRWLIREGKIK